MKHLGDITKISGYTAPIVDVVTGGSPCQDLSIAGKRAGLDGERSGLFMEQIRIVKEMRENDVRTYGRSGVDVRPRFMVWENVPGAFSTNKGEDFRVVLEEVAKVAERDAVIPGPPSGKWSKAGCIMGDGWSVAWRVHDAQFWGVAQRRKRIALLADFGGLSAPEVLFERKGVYRHPEPGESARQGSAGGSADCVGVPIGFAGYQSSFAGAPCVENGTPPLTTAAPMSICYDARGNGDGALVPTLTGDHQNRVTDYTALVQETTGYGTQEAANGMHVVSESWDGKDTAPTLTANNAGGEQRMPDKGNFNAVISYGLDRAAYNQGQNALFGIGVYEEKIGAQVAKGPSAVCTAVDARHATESETTNGTLLSKEQGYNLNSNNVARRRSIVRRLTPTECERLQGFPDGWTDIGDWVDSKGKKHKGESDSPRYKALGNSIAVGYANRQSGFWCWLARRICAQYERQVTMASLFDGIGGFPLAFSACGAVPVWASEIEEFPIAVTKVRFPEKVDR